MALTAPTLAPRRHDIARELTAPLTLSISTDLAAMESEWRRFERMAACTAFQTFDWLVTWQRHIGARQGVLPVIVVGSYASGGTAFLLPLALRRTLWGRRLCWLGQDLCDYTGPLLAPDFSQRLGADRFCGVWREICALLARDPRLRPDWILFEKMPLQIGDQINPFTALEVSPHASAAHAMRLGDNWEKFYSQKRSSATRRHDRSKRRHLAEFGEIRFVADIAPHEARPAIEILMQQKSRHLARKGLSNIFARPGCHDFLIDLATNPVTRKLIHLSCIEIGTTCAAVNLGIVFGDTYYHVVASYDDSKLAHYGPGALHLRELMAYAIGLGLQHFDFTIGDEPYKREWSDTRLELCDLITTATWRGWPASLWLRTRARFKRGLKQSALGWRVVCAFRSVIGHWQTPR